MNNLLKTITLGFVLISTTGFSQKSITQDISSENGKIKIHIEKDENGKKQVFDKVYNVEGMTEDEKQALIDQVTDSLSAGSGKNVRMKVKIDRGDENTQIDKNTKGQKKKIITKKYERKPNDNNNDENIDIEDEGFNLNFDNFSKDMVELGKTLQLKFKDLEPAMKEFTDKLEPEFKKFENSELFQFDILNNSKTIKNLNAFANKPNNNRLNVKFSAPEKGTVTITVTDLNGKEIGKESIADFAGEYIGQVALKSITIGTIFVTVVQGQDGTVKRVVLK